jgi:hypothetical protein
MHNCTYLKIVVQCISVPDPIPDPPDPRFFCLLDQDPDPLVRGMDPDPDPDPSIIMANSKKNLEYYYFVTLFDFLSLKKM